MQNFRIGIQIENEIEDYRNARVRLASLRTASNQLLRFAKTNESGYYFNQEETLASIDFAMNSQFESGPKDKNSQNKLYLNICKFRSEVSSKQIDIDVKDGKFFPTDYADPWAAIFLQKDFVEWAKDCYMGELINECVEKFPRYGTVVLKKVGKTIQFTPLQVLRNEQTAESLAKARYVIEEHPDMPKWEIDQMKGWDTKDLTLKYDQTMTVYERYGWVPLKWLKEANGQTAKEGDELIYVDSLVIAGKTPDSKMAKGTWHVFVAMQINERPYREAHWSRQHGRWLGVGVVEDQLVNQNAKNVIVNLIRRRLQWASKVIGMSRDENVVAKNLSKDVKDGEILEVGPDGEIKMLQFSSQNSAEFQQFLNEFEKNSDQKAFTYEVATGESMPSGTPFRLGVVLGGAVNTFFKGKQERLALLLEKAVREFLVPQFIRDMQSEDKVLALFSDEPGFKVVQEAAMNMVRSEAVKLSLLSGKPVDVSTIEQAVQPFQEVKALFFKRPASYYQNLKFKYTFQFGNETVDVDSKRETLKAIYQLLIQNGDPRAELVLEKIANLSGETIAQFGKPTPPPSANPAPTLPSLPSPAGAGAGSPSQENANATP